uniref:Alcohol dehydrogenase n=1 Tax=Thermus caliditerrae TaxID=1330700 RepID=A0A7C5VFL9_9DEIN
MVRRAVISEPRRVALEEVPDPGKPGPGEVLLKPLAVGICGSDVHVYEGHHPFVRYPVYPGHEVVGRVAAVGNGVEAEWLGALAVLEPSLFCGRCEPCRLGRYNICENLRVMGFQAPGALGEIFRVTVDRLHRFPEGLPPELGALIEPLAVAVHGLRLVEVRGREVGIFGGGTIGLLAAQVARAYGAARVEVVEPMAYRRSLARNLGLEAVAQPRGPYQVAVEAVGAEGSLEGALHSLRKGGEIAVLGVFGGPVRFPAHLVQDWELVVRGSLMYTFQDFQEAIRLLAQAQVEVAPLVTHRFPLSRVEDAFRKALDREEALKVLVLVEEGHA